MSSQDTPYLLPVIQAIQKKVSKTRVEGLKGPGECILLSLVKSRIKKNCLFITPTPNEAERSFADLRFFSSNDPAYLYPTREILPYEELEPDPLLISQRI